MSISRMKRKRRAELAAIRKLKCTKHGQRNGACENRDCLKQIREDFYGTRRKKLIHDVPKTIDIEALFRRLREPIYYDDDLSDDFVEARPPVAPSPVLSIPPQDQGQAYSEAERKLTLRELIARKVA